MRITLNDLNMLPGFTKRFDNKIDSDLYFEYAENVCNQIFGDISLHYLEKLGIDRFETVFIGSKPYSVFNLKKLARISSADYKRKLRQALLIKEILKGKPIYICRLVNEKGYYEFSFPEPVYFELAESTMENGKVKRLRKRLDKTNNKNGGEEPFKINVKKIQAYLVRVNLKSLRSLITLAKRDFDFVERFNNEMFHQTISFNNRTLTRDEIASFYNTEKFIKILDLSDARERIAFISLYGITFKGLELNDFYSIDGIFSLQPNRERDSLKQLSGNEVFGLIMSENRQSLAQTISKMGEALLRLPVPALKLNDYNLLKQNYSLYCGISDIGRLFTRLIVPEIGSRFETFHRTAVRMTDYSLTERYFDFILKCDDGFDLNGNSIYEALSGFEKAVGGKKITAELSHGSKEFKL